MKPEVHTIGGDSLWWRTADLADESMERERERESGITAAILHLVNRMG